jgi:hypothetical protein
MTTLLLGYLVPLKYAQLLDAKTNVVFSHEAGTIFSNYEKNILLEDYPSGVFYMKVYFKPIAGNIKTGIYKIIKL